MTPLIRVTLDLDLLDHSCESVDESEDGHLRVGLTDASTHPQDRPNRDLDLDWTSSLEVHEGGRLVLKMDT